MPVCALLVPPVFLPLSADGGRAVGGSGSGASVGRVEGGCVGAVVDREGGELVEGPVPLEDVGGAAAVELELGGASEVVEVVGGDGGDGGGLGGNGGNGFGSVTEGGFGGEPDSAGVESELGDCSFDGFLVKGHLREKWEGGMEGERKVNDG